MWARVVRLPGGAAPDFPDLIRSAVASQVPITLSSPGNRGALALVDPASSTMLTITLWRTLDDLVSTGAQMRGVVEDLEASTRADRKATEIRPWRLVACDVPVVLGPPEPPGGGPSSFCARVIAAQGEPGPDTVARIRTASIAVRDIYLTTPGFNGGLVVADTATGRLLACQLWSDRDHLMAAAERVRAGTQGVSLAVGADTSSTRIALWDVLACDVPVRILTDEDDPDP